MAFCIIFSVLNIFVAFAMEQATASHATNTSEAYKNLSNSCNDFTTAFYAQLSSTSVENTITSPLSIHMILSQLSHGAESVTLDELTKGLYHYDKGLIKEGYQALISRLNELENIKLYIANTMYIQDKFELLGDFLTLGKKVYQSEISKINFKLSANAADTINAWVKEKTNNKIVNVVSSADFDEDTKLVLINAIYFNGSWLQKFEATRTQQRVFHMTKDQEKLVPTMFNKAKYNYGNIPKLHAKFIEIPYMNKDIVMTIILPDEIDGLSNLQNNFSWKLLGSASRAHNDVELYLPKFKIEFTLNLKNILQKLGLSTMFESNANFNRISNVPLVVNKVLHKAVIEINEEGTEAAASTLVHIRLRRMIDIDEPQEFRVDRPFMFIIEYKPNNIPLFIGNIRDIGDAPQKDEL